MQEQEKKTTRTRKTAEKTTEQTFTLEQVQKLIQEALAKHDAETKESKPLVQNDGVVTMIYQDEVNDASQILLGPNGKYGMITGKHATITVQKRDFISDFRTTMVQYLMKNRNLIVIDGLTDEERKIYGLEYKQGEYLEPAVYERLIDMGDEVVGIFDKLHPTWQEMIATKFIEAYENGTLKCSRDALMALNKMSKKNYAGFGKDDPRRKGAFYAIIHQMNAADESED